MHWHAGNIDCNHTSVSEMVDVPFLRENCDSPGVLLIHNLGDHGTHVKINRSEGEEVIGLGRKVKEVMGRNMTEMWT